MVKKRYRRCCNCNNKAVWCYMPSGDGKHHYCDNCVPRGCSCNLNNIEFDGLPDESRNIVWWSKKTYEKWGETDSSIKLEELSTKEQMPDSFYYEYLDENNKRYCCCEYWYDDDDIIEERHYTIRKVDIKNMLETSKFKLSISDRLRVSIIDFIETLNDEGDYNIFMSHFYNVCEPYMKIGYNAKINISFYRSVRDRLRKLRVKKLFDWEK